MKNGRIGFMICLTALLLGLAACGKPAQPSSAGGTRPQEKPFLRVMSLKGPTSMGLVKLAEDNEQGLTKNRYSLEMVTAADEITAALATGRTDVAFLPANAAAALYNKAGGFRLAAINNLGVLHLVEKGSSIRSLTDLRGRTVFLTGKGTTPEYALRYLLAACGIEQEVTLEFKSEAAEVAAALNSDAAALGLLPEPFATAVLLQNGALRRALDLNTAWAELTEGSAMVTGVCVIREAVLTEQPEAVRDFLGEFRASLEYSNTEPEAAAEKIAERGIVSKAVIAEKALPGCSLRYIDGEEMKTLVSAYLKTLYDQNPAAVGGKLPDDAFWYLYE